MTTAGLRGWRIVITRPRAQAGGLRALLEAQGAEVIEFPSIRVAQLDDYAAVDRAIGRLGEYQWLIFTSQNGVAAFVDRLRACGRDVAELGRVRLAAIGPATARALEMHGHRPAVSPARFVAEALVEAMTPEHLRGARVLLPRAMDARPVLPDGLRALGAAVEVVPVYRIEPEPGRSSDAMRRLQDGAVDCITFTSSSTVRSFVEVLGEAGIRLPDRTIVACIGPVTAATARDCGLGVGVVADAYTIPGLVDALRDRLGGTVPTGATR
jgi:uroporphyrinogen III methyltransferase/synthase